MAIPLISHVQYASQALQVLAALTVRDRPRPVLYHRAIVFCCALLLFGSMALIATALVGHNLWLAYLTAPLEVWLFLWLLAAMQPTEFLRTASMLAIPVTGLVVVAMLVLTDPAKTFFVLVLPGLALLSLAASLGTLVLRSLQARAPLVLQDWFWLCLGLSLFWLNSVSVSIFLQAYVREHPDWVMTALVARAWVDILAYSLMAWGLLQPWLRARSSGSS